jgi:hypothetical protein
MKDVFKEAGPRFKVLKKSILDYQRVIEKARKVAEQEAKKVAAAAARAERAHGHGRGTRGGRQGGGRGARGMGLWPRVMVQVQMMWIQSHQGWQSHWGVTQTQTLRVKQRSQSKYHTDSAKFG